MKINIQRKLKIINGLKNCPSLFYGNKKAMAGNPVCACQFINVIQGFDDMTRYYLKPT